MRAAWKALVLGGAMLATRPAVAAPQDNEPPEITPDAVKPPDPGKPLVVECDITDKSGVFDPLVYWKPAGGKEFARANLKPVGGTRFRAEIKLPPSTKEIEYFLEAFDENGNGPTRVGNDQKPLKASMEPPPPPKKELPPPPAASSGGLPVPAIASIAVGGAGLVASGVFGFLASGEYDSFKATRDPVTKPQLASAVRTDALIADVSLAIGLVGVGVGGYLLATAPAAAPEEPEDKAHLVFVPNLGGFSVQGAF